MTNARQVRLIYQPLMARHPYLKAATSRRVCKAPVGHLACFVFIERISHPDVFVPMWFITTLFRPGIPIDSMLGTYQEDLYRPEGSSTSSWLWSDPTSIPEVIGVIENTALPKLHRFGTLEGYAARPPAPSQSYREQPEDRMLTEIALGNLDVARTIWLEREPLYRGRSYSQGSPWQRWQMQLAAVAEPLRAGNRQALARILHDWEASNVRGTSIERYWEPTPFPLERGPG